MEEEREIKEEEQTKELLAKSEISLLLDTYDDIFSDFDPRPYAQRALSDDFLLEAKKAALTKEGALQLRFMIPRQQRRLDQEVIIKKRLREHFKKHMLLIEEQVQKTRRWGWGLIGVGIIMMFLSIVFYSDLLPITGIFKNILIVLTEPSGWFLFWIGGEKLVYERREKEPELTFYRKMTLAELLFISY